MTESSCDLLVKFAFFATCYSCSKAPCKWMKVINRENTRFLSSRFIQLGKKKYIFQKCTYRFVWFLFLFKIFILKQYHDHRYLFVTFVATCRVNNMRVNPHFKTTSKSVSYAYRGIKLLSIDPDSNYYVNEQPTVSWTPSQTSRN